MKNQSIIYGIAGLVVGVLLTSLVMSNQNKQIPAKSNSAMSHESIQANDSSSMSMEEMVADLKGKSGEEFDKSFLIAMILHHKDALTMAKDAKKNAKRDEIKNLADEIISAQTAEINQMQTWQKEWGYSNEH